MKRTIIVMVIVALLCSAGLMANGVSEGTPIVTLRFEQFSGTDSNDSGPALKEMIAAFEAKNPNIKVELQTIGYDDYFTQLQSKVVGGNASDVFELNFENFVSYASEGALADIDKMVGDTAGFNQTALGAFKYDGIQYGVPCSFSNVVLFYNKALFDKAGIAYPTDDWTWTDMEKAGKAIRALGNDIYGLYRPTTFHEFYKGVKQNGGALMTEDGKAFTMTLVQNVETLERMVGWQNDSNIMPTEAQMGGMGDWDLFKSGRLGMIVTGIWGFSDFTTGCSFDWDIIVEPGNTQHASHFFANGYVVSATSKHQKEAAMLASFLGGSREAAQIRVKANWELPPVNYEDILASYLQITPPENREAVFKSLDYLVTPPVVKQQAEMQDIIGGYLSQVVYKKMDAKSALEACQAELEAKITL
ncbi:MAG: sugar ABC transporter substrate-binding protein [Sphaerochaetaceae bacterium]